MPVVITKKHPIWHAVENGNVPFIQQLFGQGFSPYVIDEDGQSLVLVRTDLIPCIAYPCHIETTAFALISISSDVRGIVTSRDHSYNFAKSPSYTAQYLTKYTASSQVLPRSDCQVPDTAGCED
jgi:hypothetical protein